MLYIWLMESGHKTVSICLQRGKDSDHPQVKMSLRRTIAIARKEFRHIARDLRLLFLVTISPAFLLLALAYVFSFDIRMVNLAVMDLDQSRLSRQYISTLTNDGIETFR